MLNLYLILFILTFIVTRILTHLLHNKKNENKSKTLTGKNRVLTKVDFHHIHIGIVIVVTTTVWIYLFNLNTYNLSLLVIGISLICDQVFPLICKKICYFSKVGISLAILNHLILLLILNYYLL